MRILVLHHNDADGFGAAYAAWSALAPLNEVVFVPVQYGQEPPEEVDQNFDHIYVLDFSYKRAIMEQLAAKTGYLLCLDHHKTAEAELAGLPYCVFDQTKSGAVLAWEHFYPLDTCIPTILQYVQDRDLWQFKLLASKAVNAYIATLGWDFDAWEAFHLDTAISCGEAIIAFQEGQIKGRLKDTRWMWFDPTALLSESVHSVLELVKDDRVSVVRKRVPCINASENISELGNRMCEEHPEAPFSMSYCDRQDGSRSYSLRSIGDFDVSAVAKTFGGGGHKNAAGFTLRAPEVL